MISSLYKGMLYGAGLWTVAIPIIKWSTANVFATTPAISTSIGLLTLGLGVAYATVKSLDLFGIPKKDRLAAMVVGTCVANIIDGTVFTLFPTFYSDNAAASLSAVGHILWITSWGLVFAL